MAARADLAVADHGAVVCVHLAKTDAHEAGLMLSQHDPNQYPSDGAYLEDGPDLWLWQRRRERRLIRQPSQGLSPLASPLALVSLAS